MKGPGRGPDVQALERRRHPGGRGARQARGVGRRVEAGPRRRGGFSAIELLVSLALLSVIVVALGGAAVRYARGAPASGSRTAARLATDRIEEVRAHHCYDELATRFQGIEFDLGGTPDAYRRTRVTRILETVDGGETDLTLVSVEVFLPGLSEPIERTATLRAP